MQIKNIYLSVFFKSYQYNQQEQEILVLVLSFFPYNHSNFISFVFNIKRHLINNIPMRKYSLWESLSRSKLLRWAVNQKDSATGKYAWTFSSLKTSSLLCEKHRQTPLIISLGVYISHKYCSWYLGVVVISTA